MHELQYSEYLDRIYAGWLGKSLGGIVGAPFECHKHFTEIGKDALWPEILYPNDDLDIQVVWLEAMLKHGVNPTPEQLALFWKENCLWVCCEYGIFIDNLEHGIYPPLSGTWNNDFFHQSEGCPIRSEIWGFIAPGNPALAMDYAKRDGQLDHSSYSVEIEQFLSAAASLSFFEKDPAALLEKTCQVVPEDNAGRRIFNMVRELSSGISDTYEIWRRLVRTCGSCDGTNARLNNAFAILALFRGGNDFKEVMRLCVQFGWDVDCTCATAGALWGALHGSKAFPEDWVEKMGKTLICACDIPHKNALLTDFAAETAALGIEAAALLNHETVILNAPPVTIRPLPPETIRMDAVYPGDPVLFSGKPACFQLKFTNPLKQDFHGTLRISLPADVQLNRTEAEISIPAEGSSLLDLSAFLCKEAECLHDRNLFEGVLTDGNGRDVCRHVFGLQGAELWQYYGPYWDMWDVEKSEKCPYWNEKVTVNPGMMPGYLCDALNTHVRLKHPYLDEAALLKHDLPEEFPLVVEKGGRLFKREDFTAFDGAGCCYLVREIRSDGPVNGHLEFEADCPYECYLDGVLIDHIDEHTRMNSTPGLRPEIHFTGEWQRFVVKLCTRLDRYSIRTVFSADPGPHKGAASTYVSVDTRIPSAQSIRQVF